RRPPAPGPSGPSTVNFPGERYSTLRRDRPEVGLLISTPRLRVTPSSASLSPPPRRARKEFSANSAPGRRPSLPGRPRRRRSRPIGRADEAERGARASGRIVHTDQGAVVARPLRLAARSIEAQDDLGVLDPVAALEALVA